MTRPCTRGWVAARAEVRHVLLGAGEGERSGRRRLLLLAALLASAACAAAAASRSGDGGQADAAVLLVPATVVLTVSLVVVVLDQTLPRGVPGVLAILPLSRPTLHRVLRAPWLVVLGLVVLLVAPSAVLVLVGADLGPGEAALVVIGGGVVGCGVGLACSVLATRLVDLGRAWAPPVASAPAAIVLWIGWAAASVWTSLWPSGWARWCSDLVTGWPRIVDQVTGQSHPVPTVVLVAGWACAVYVLAGARRPAVGRAQTWRTWSFRRLPILALTVVRVLRARPCQVHLLMAIALTVAVLGAEAARPGVGPRGAAIAVAAMLCAVCAAAARGLDGAVSLDVRWFVSSSRHTLAVVGGTLLCAAPITAVAVTALHVGSPVPAVAHASLVLVAAPLGVAVGAVLGAPSGAPAAELGSLAAFVATAGLLSAVLGDLHPTWFVLASAVVAVAALLVAAIAESTHHDRHRRGTAIPPGRRTA